MSKPTEESMIQVTAPATLEAGYQFDARTDDGLVFKVVVPEGGVKEGQQFLVPSPNKFQPSEQPIIHTVNADNSAVLNAPNEIRGRFKTGLCDWTQICCSSLWWMGLCCTPLVQAQVMTRLSLDPCGNKVPASTASKTFSSMMLFFFLYLIFNWWIPFVGMAWFIFAMIFGTKFRGEFRRRYEIGNSDCCADCCCTFWCGCCTAIQMARHTHDEKKYRYQACAENGLPRDAPAIV